MSKPDLNLWLRRFRVDVTSNSNRVYANGRQQVEVTVTIEPRANETITAEQYDSIFLVEIDDNGQVKPLNDLLKAFTERDQRFEYHAATGSAPSALMESSPATLRKRFYVTSELPGGTLSTVYAGIWKDPSDSSTTYESNTGSFKSNVILESVLPLRLTKEHFILEREDLEHPDTVADADGYALSIRNPNYRIVESVPYGVGSGLAYYRNTQDRPIMDVFSQQTSIHHIAYAVNTPLSHVFLDAAESRPAKPGTLYLLRLVTYANAEGGIERSDAKWGLIDQHGNEHLLELTQADEGNVIDFRMNA